MQGSHVYFNTEHMESNKNRLEKPEQGKIPNRFVHLQNYRVNFAQLVKHLQYHSLVILQPICPKCHWTFTWWGQTGLLTYVFVCFLLLMESTIITYTIYCDVTATTGHWSMENQNALTPTRIQLKHSPILGRLFQRVVSGWKATQKRCGSTRPGQNVALIGINTMTLSGRIRETFKIAWKVYHNSSDHNGSVFHWGVVGDLRVHNIYKSRVLVPVPNLQRKITG